MKRAVLGFFLLLAAAGCAFAANETIDELIAQLEGKSPETAAQEREQKWVVEEAEREIAAVKKALRFNTDKIENVTWVHTRLTQFRPVFDIYCGERGGRIWMRLLLEPRSDTRPMVMEQVVLNIGGEVRNFSIKAGDRNITSEVRAVKGTFGGVDVNRWYYERIDMPVTPELEKILWRAAGSKSVLVRFRGRYVEDFKLSKAAHNAYSAILRYYRARQVILAHEKGGW